MAAPFVEGWARWRGRDPIFTRESMRALGAPRVSHAKATRELGHRPRPTEQSVHDVHAWFEAAGYLNRESGGGRRTDSAA
jgi:hypothetical protein